MVSSNIHIGPPRFTGRGKMDVKKSLLAKWVPVIFVGILFLSCAKNGGDSAERVSLPAVESYAEVSAEGEVVDAAFAEGGVYLARSDAETGGTEIVCLGFDGETERPVYETERPAAHIQSAPDGFCALWTDSSLTRFLVGEDGEIREEEPIAPPAGAQLLTLDAGIRYLTVASADRVWQRKWDGTEWKQVDLSGILFRQIEAMCSSDDGGLWLVTDRNEASGAGTVYRLNEKGAPVRAYEDVSIALCYSDGTRFWFTNGTNDLRMIDTDGEIRSLQRLPVQENLMFRSPTDMAKGTFDFSQKLCVSADTAALVWGTQEKGVMTTRIALYARQAPLDMIRILVSSEMAPNLNNVVLYMMDMPNVRVTEISAAGFSDVLSAKLLAGDNDFDLVYTGGEQIDQGILFDTLIRHHLYADLYEEKALADHFGDMYTGLRKAVESEGEAVILPTDLHYKLYSVLDEERYPETDRKGLTAEEVWALCETLLREGNGCAVFDSENPYASAQLLAEMLQGYLARAANDSLTDENSVREVLTEFLENVRRYDDANVLFGKPSVLRCSYYGMFPFGLGYSMVDHDHRNVPGPVFDEQSGIALEISGFWFVNRNAGNKEGAYRFLTEMTNEENRYNAHLFTSPLFPPTAQYHFLPGYSSMPAVRDVPFYTEIDDLLEECYSVSFISRIGSADTITGILRSFLSGGMDSSEAAESILKDVYYHILG